MINNANYKNKKKHYINNKYQKIANINKNNKILLCNKKNNKNQKSYNNMNNTNKNLNKIHLIC